MKNLIQKLNIWLGNECPHCHQPLEAWSDRKSICRDCGYTWK